MLRSKTCYRMEFRFSSTYSRDQSSSILLHPDDGVDHVLLRGEHLLLLLVAKVLPQVKSPPVASLAPSSTVPAWHLLALLPSCSLQIISEESGVQTLRRCVFINDTARSSGIIHLSLNTLPFGGFTCGDSFGIRMKMSVKRQYQVGKHLCRAFQTKKWQFVGPY